MLDAFYFLNIDRIVQIILLFYKLNCYASGYSLMMHIIHLRVLCDYDEKIFGLGEETMRAMQQAVPER